MRSYGIEHLLAGIRERYQSATEQLKAAQKEVFELRHKLRWYQDRYPRKLVGGSIRARLENE